MKQAKLLKKIRNKLGLSQKELESCLGYGSSGHFVSKIERGTRHIPVEMAYKLCHKFKLGPDQFRVSYSEDVDNEWKRKFVFHSKRIK